LAREAYDAGATCSGAALVGKRLIWTWPRDGRRETLEGAGISLAKQYKLYDDLMAATRYAVMMLREAKTLEPQPPFVMPRVARGGWMPS
jgi:hypothetical protein